MDVKAEIESVKKTIDGFLTPDLDKAKIDELAKASQKLDEISAGYVEVEGQLGTMRKDYIDMVKRTGFKPTNDDKGTDNATETPRTIDEIAADIIAKRAK